MDAEAELRRILEIDESFPLAVGTLGAICAQQGRFEEALTWSERAYTLTPWSHPINGQLAALLVRAGASSRADALLENLGTGAAYGAPTGLAVFHALCGNWIGRWNLPSKRLKSAIRDSSRSWGRSCEPVPGGPPSRNA